MLHSKLDRNFIDEMERKCTLDVKMYKMLILLDKVRLILFAIKATGLHERLK